ncbi:MAG TPA: hypothetical protein VLJ17_11410 [Xanthobacteraceae bacterium]|nr:hypothetical protein [Xanthobacteraceae bacterium]
MASRHPEMSLAFLALMSVIFFASSGGNTLLLVLSVLINYALGIVIANGQNNKTTMATYSLIVALISNLGTLAYYKYANWRIDNISNITGHRWRPWM